MNEIDLFSRQSRILPCSVNCLPKNIRTVFFTCRDADIPLNQHGAHAAERINNLCILFQIRRCQFHNQCRKRRVHGSCNCMFPVRKPVIRKGIKSQCREKLSLTICNQSKFYLIIPRRIHQFSIRQLFNGRSKLFDKPASLFQCHCGSALNPEKEWLVFPVVFCTDCKHWLPHRLCCFFRFLLQKSFDRNQKQHVPICADLQQLQQIIRLYNHTERMRLSTGLIFQYSAMIAVCHQKYMIVLLFYIKMMGIDSFILKQDCPQCPQFCFPVFPVFFGDLLSFQLCKTIFQLRKDFFCMKCLHGFQICTFYEQCLFSGICFPERLQRILYCQVSQKKCCILPRLCILFL